MVTSLLLPIALLAQRRTVLTLADFLRASPQPDSIAVAPESVRGKGDGRLLADYDRMAVRIGGLEAIVPTTTVLFNDALAQPPNLYDGLPREDKVLYLLSLLRPDQIRLAAERGLSSADLQGEPRDVLASILPHRLAWRRIVLDENRQTKGDTESGTVEEKEMARVRVQLVRSLSLDIPHADDDHTFSQASTSLRTNLAGSDALVRVRGDDEETNPDSEFGVGLRAVVPNRPKPGDLPFSRLNRSVPLPPSTTLGEAVEGAAKGAGLEILADIRIRSLPVVHSGGPVVAGDLLKALALAVGGTYRKVGNAFLLTSDEAGMGARQLRFDAWTWGVRGEIARRRALWQRAIAKARKTESIGFAGDDPLAPGEAMRSAIRANAGSWEATIPASMLTPALKDFVDRYRRLYPTENLRDDRFAAGETFGFRFVLPDGRALAEEYRFFGTAGELEPPISGIPAPPQMPTPKEAASPIVLDDRGPSVSVLLRTDCRQEAESAIARIQAHGLHEVWLDTTNADVLRAAIATKCGIKLAISPFAPRVENGGDVPDRNVLGDTGDELAGRIAKEAPFMDYVGPSPLPLRAERTVESEGAGWSSRLKGWAALAKTAGLRGVVLLDTAPPGYEGSHGNSYSTDYPPRRSMVAALGYTEAQRLRFLRREGVDPIDLGCPFFEGRLDLSPPFFPDDALAARYARRPGFREVVPMAPLRQKWDLARSESNQAALSSLLASLSSLPIEIEARPTDGNLPAPSPRLVSGWTPGSPLPQAAGPNEPRPLGTAVVSIAPDEEPALVRSRLLPLLRFPTEASGQSWGRPQPVVLDLSRVPFARLPELLDLLFARKAGR